MPIEIRLLIVGLIFVVIAAIMLSIKKFFVSKRAKAIFDFIYSWVDTIWSALLIAAFIMYFFVQAFKIPTGSMRNTFLEGDHLFVSKFIYGMQIPFSGGRRFFQLREVQRGDIIIFRSPQNALSISDRERNVRKDYIKRAVAIGGDTVEIRDKQLFVNGMQVYEPYVIFKDSQTMQNFNLFASQAEYQEAWESGKFTSLPYSFFRDNFGPVTVPEGMYFVLGDNRDFSFDSRFWGPLDDRNLIGRALVIYWPLNRIARNLRS
ncbi:MAG: signal peptidase I [Elusimicrobia bacterium]|nr:signal peptidase I [Elusimicrobiota bacterium]